MQAVFLGELMETKHSDNMSILSKGAYGFAFRWIDGHTVDMVHFPSNFSVYIYPSDRAEYEARKALPIGSYQPGKYSNVSDGYNKMWATNQW